MSARERPRREFEVDQDPWLAIDAWRDSGDLGLCYLVPLDAGLPTADDRMDRRAVLEPGQTLGSLDGEAMLALWSRAVPLTDTERRITGPDDALWLARNTGPVWAGGAAASDSTGVLFRCLSAEGPVIEIAPAGPLRDEPPDRLRELLAQGGSSS